MGKWIVGSLLWVVAFLIAISIASSIWLFFSDKRVQTVLTRSSPDVNELQSSGAKIIVPISAINTSMAGRKFLIPFKDWTSANVQDIEVLKSVGPVRIAANIVLGDAERDWILATGKSEIFARLEDAEDLILLEIIGFRVNQISLRFPTASRGTFVLPRAISNIASAAGDLMTRRIHPGSGSISIGDFEIPIVVPNQVFPAGDSRVTMAIKVANPIKLRLGATKPNVVSLGNSIFIGAIP